MMEYRLKESSEKIGAGMELSLLLLADYANVAEKSKLNVMGVFTDVYASNFPARHPEMYLVIKLSAGPAEYGRNFRLAVKLLNADATQELVNFSQEIAVPEGQPGRKTEVVPIMKIRDIVFPQPGTYQFSVLVDGDEKGSIPVHLIQGEP